MTNMDTSVREFGRPIPEKIREGREARGYTMEAFAERIGVSKQAVAQYETGQCVPGGDVFSRIIAETSQPITFFTDPRRRSGEPSAPFWRSLKRMELAHRRRVFRRLQWASDALEFVEGYVQIPTVNLPEINFDVDVDGAEEIEKAAQALREHWRLGDGPIRHLGLTLEENGVVLVREMVDCPDMDGVSCWIAGRPYILLSAEVEGGPRDLFNLAHELAHVVLHAGVDVTSENLKRIEQQANRFASAFLLPSESFSREVFGTSISHFKSLKLRWGVAISAMAYRCKDLGILSVDQFAYIMRQMNSTGIRKTEPLDDAFDVSRPSMLHQAMKMIVDHGVCSRAQVESALALNLRDVESICNLSEGFLEHRILQFSLRSDRAL